MHIIRYLILVTLIISLSGCQNIQQATDTKSEQNTATTPESIKPTEQNTGQTYQASWQPSTPTTPPDVFVQLGHSENVNAVAFSPDGKLALSGSRDKTLKLWEVSSGREIRTFKGHSSSINAVVFSPDGKLALSGSYDNTLKLWQVDSGREIRTFKGPSHWVKAVAFSPDGKLALSGSKDNTLKLWQVSSGREIRTFKGHSWSVNAVAFSPDGKLALSGSGDHTLKLWQVLSGREIRTFRGHSEGVNSIAFSPDGKLALSGSYDHTLKLWQVDSGREIRTFKGHSDEVSSVAFSPDGKLALSGSSDYTLKLWQVDSGREIRTFKGHSSHVWAVAFSPDGKLALSGSFDKTLKLWQVDSGREIRTFKGHSQPVRAVAFSPDGKLALSGSWDDTLKLWQVDSGREIRTFKGHSYEVEAVAFSPDGKLPLSGSWDGTTRLWNIQTGKELAQMFTFDNDEWVTITPEGYYTASLNGAKYINVSIGTQSYSIDQYESIYHRPNIVKLAIKLGDTQQAIAQLTHGAQPIQFAQVQPPKIWFVSPQSGSETKAASIKVQIKTENIADSADAVTFFVNGRPMRKVKSAKTSIQAQTQPIPLIVGENWIKAQVRGKAGATSETEPLLVIRQSREKPKPNLYYLGIGVAQYSHPQLRLKYPTKDVKGLETVLKQQQGKAYQRVFSKTLTDQQATRSNIIQNVMSFFEPAKQGDIAILFISGHGMNSDKLGYYFLSYDASPDQFEVSSVSWKDFNVINDLKANVLLLADTCHSGNIAGNAVWQQRAKADPNQFLNDSHRSNVIVFASSSGGDFSLEDPKWEHGAFTKALIEGLGGKAAYKKGMVKLSFLQDYVRDRVVEITDGAQTPTIPRFEGSGSFFNLVLAKIGRQAQTMLEWTQRLAKLNLKL